MFEEIGLGSGLSVCLLPFALFAAAVSGGGGAAAAGFATMRRISAGGPEFSERGRALFEQAFLVFAETALAVATPAAGELVAAVAAPPLGSRRLDGRWSGWCSAVAAGAVCAPVRLCERGRGACDLRLVLE